MKASITVNAKNPGVGAIVEKIIEAMNTISGLDLSPDDAPIKIVERLAEKFEFDIDHASVNTSVKPLIKT